MSEEVAELWVPGTGPVDVEPLAPGIVNRSFRVTRAGRQFSLRLADTETPDLGVDRRFECQIRSRASREGLAAAVHHCDPDNGILVADWMPGRCWTPEESELPENIDAMADLLRRVHMLVIPEPARCMDPGAWITLYGTAGSGPRTGAAHPRLHAAAMSHLSALGAAGPRVVCHSDLHRLNVIVRQRPALLDWEYAHVSEPFWDLAGWIANNDWPRATAGRFLASYLRDQVRPTDTRRLDHFIWLYDYVCLLWSEIFLQKRPGDASAMVRARADLLARRLALGLG